LVEYGIGLFLVGLGELDGTAVALGEFDDGAERDLRGEKRGAQQESGCRREGNADQLPARYVEAWHVLGSNRVH
jgi:hypothetical protein